jgi:hypothetical protein
MGLNELDSDQLRQLLEAEDQALSEAQDKVSSIRQRILFLEFRLAERAAHRAIEAAGNRP